MVVCCSGAPFPRRKGAGPERRCSPTIQPEIALLLRRVTRKTRIADVTAAPTARVLIAPGRSSPGELVAKCCSHPGVGYDAMIQMQVRSADTRPRNTNNGVIRMHDPRIGTVLIGAYPKGSAVIHCEHTFSNSRYEIFFPSPVSFIALSVKLLHHPETFFRAFATNLRASFTILQLLRIALAFFRACVADHRARMAQQ